MGRAERSKTRKAVRLSRKKIVYLTIAITCVMFVLSMFFVQAFSSQKSAIQKDDEAQMGGDGVSAIPLLGVILPIAAAVAYVLERITSKKNSSRAL